MDQEIQYIAVVQLSGLIGDAVGDKPSVATAGFATHLGAVEWVRKQVEDAHGEVALVVPHFTKLAYDFGAEPVRTDRWLWTILTSGGPTWGMVIDVSESAAQG